MSADIVFIIGAYKNGGVARHSTVLANEFGKRGKKIIILATGKIGKERFLPLQDNVEIVGLTDYLESQRKSPQYRRYINKVNLKIKYKKILRRFSNSDKKEKYAKDVSDIRKGLNLGFFLREQYEAVLIPFGIEYCKIAVAACKSLHNPIIFAEKNASEVETGNELTLRNDAEILSKCDAGIFQTEDEKAVYASLVKDIPLYVIHNPINPDLPEPYFGKRRNVIVNFCRVSKQKNLPLMIDAFKLLSDRYPDYKVEIYGNIVFDVEQKLKEELEAYIYSQGLQDRVTILPTRSDVHEVVKDCKMFVSSSDYEGISNSMIEAMAIGMPCVCTDCLGGGAREIINDGINGLLVPMNNAKALADAMERYIIDDALLRRCSHNASKLIETMDVGTISTEWLKTIESVNR